MSTAPGTGSCASAIPGFAVLGDDQTVTACLLSLVRNGSATIGVTQPSTGSGRWSGKSPSSQEGCPVNLTHLTSEQDILGWHELVATTRFVVCGAGAATARSSNCSAAYPRRCDAAGR